MLILQILSLESAPRVRDRAAVGADIALGGPGQRRLALPRPPPAGAERLASRRLEQSETGREAKFYSLTPAGRRQLAVEKDSWARLSSAVNLIFEEGSR